MNNGILTTPLDERKKFPIKAAFANTLIAIQEKYNNIVVFDADLQACSGTKPFQEKFPKRHFNVGVAEQNMVGIAAGLSLSGKLVPFASSFACFLAKRAGDQMDISVGLNQSNVKICGDYCCLTTATNGPSHGSLGDVAFAQTIPEMVILSPADTVELEKMMWAMVEHQGPVYLRKPKGEMTQIFTEDYKFKIGKAVELTEGDDAAIISYGAMVWQCLLAAELLRKKGVKAKVINMSTIKPWDRELVYRLAERIRWIVVVENHNIISGLGSEIGTWLMEAGQCRCRFKRLGVPDKYQPAASFEYLLDYFELSPKYIAQAVEKLLGFPPRDLRIAREVAQMMD